MLRTPLEPSVRVGKEFINQDETRVLSPLLTTYIYFVASILHYVIDSCLPLTAMSSPQVFLHLLRHYSVIERRRTVTPLSSPSPSRLPISLHIAQYSCKSAQKTLLKQNGDSWRHAGSQFVILKKLIRTGSKTSTSKKGHWYWLGTHVMMMTLVGKLSHGTSGWWW